MGRICLAKHCFLEQVAERTGGGDGRAATGLGLGGIAHAWG